MREEPFTNLANSSQIPRTPNSPEAALAARDRFSGGPQHDRFVAFATWWNRRICEEYEIKGSWLAACSAVQHDWLNNPEAPKP